MPNWSSRPTHEQVNNHLQLVRTPTKGRQGGIILSDDLTGCDTHFYRNRTTPCTAPDCPACNAGYPSRWHAWIAVWSPKSDSIVIFEMTATVADAFARYHDHYGTLRGAEMIVERPSRTPNGRIKVEIRPANLNGVTLPPCPDVQAQLSRIWSIPTDDLARQPADGGNGQLQATLRDAIRVSDPTLRRQIPRKVT